MRINGAVLLLVRILLAFALFLPNRNSSTADGHRLDGDAFAARLPVQASRTGGSLAQADAGAPDLIDVGRENWEHPWAPDLMHEGQPMSLPADRVMDVLILGDGYLPNERSRFISDLQTWYRDFTELTPWHEFRGAFRVRGLWIPSQARATPALKSYFQLPATRKDVGDHYTLETRTRLFDGLRKAGLLSGTPDHIHRYVTGVVLVLAGDDSGDSDHTTGASGHARRITSPDGTIKVEFGIGSYSLHEFSHARAGVHDEYIRAVDEASYGDHPWRMTIFNNSNISYSRDPAHIPWQHLLPGSPDNPDPKSVIGLLWLGGDYELRAWHSEPYCLMNGVSSNWNLAKTKRGAFLRRGHRYCFWCEELIAATLFTRTGQLGEGGAKTVWGRWETTGRSRYQSIFNVPARIVERNQEYAADRVVQAAKIVEKPVPGALDPDPHKLAPGAKHPDDPDQDDPKKPGPASLN